MRLILPTIKYRKSFLDYMNELLRSGKIQREHFDTMRKDFSGFVQVQRSQATHPQKEDVPVTQYWIVEKNKIIGQGVLHHRLNKHLKKFGGHVGYSIRPSERRKGYGRKALVLLLRKAKNKGLKNVLLVVRKENIPSIKIIESEGGKFKRQIQDEKKTLYRQYVINLKP